MKKIEKSFDCLAFKWKAQAKIYEQTRGLSPKEEAEWYRSQARTGPFRRFFERSIQAGGSRDSRKLA